MRCKLWPAPDSTALVPYQGKGVQMSNTIIISFATARQHAARTSAAEKLCSGRNSKEPGTRQFFARCLERRRPTVSNVAGLAPLSNVPGAPERLPQ